MNAVATITPEPKYFAMKKAHDGTPTPRCRAANTGNHVPKNDPTRITKMDDIRKPKRPSNSLPVSHVGTAVSAPDMFEVAVYTSLAK